MISGDRANPQLVIEDLARNRISEDRAEELLRESLIKAEHRGILFALLRVLTSRYERRGVR